MKNLIKYISIFIVVFVLPIATKAAPSLDDYWNNKVVWKPTLEIKETQPGWTAGFGSAAQVKVVGNTWYLFTRHVLWGQKPAYCPQENMTMEVRKSTDAGVTWSTPQDILTNTPGTPWECAATDGGMYYEPSNQTWHFLFQCLSRTGTWKGCYASRNTADPMGTFTSSPANPVIESGELWDKVCDAASDKCRQEATGSIGKVIDEGTFDVFHFDGQYFWVSFHGYDGKHGFRGIAKTTNFIDWVAGNANTGVPTDSILNPSDAQLWHASWNGPSVGFGASRIIKDGSYYYQLAEAADQNLGDSIVANWGDGIYRSTSLSSNTWSVPTAITNPILFSDPALKVSDPPANPAYIGLFKDASGRTFMHFSRAGYFPQNSGIFFFSLYLPADITKNDQVDIFDYNQIIADFGKSGTPSDINSTGAVDIFDYNLLVANFGKKAS